MANNRVFLAQGLSTNGQAVGGMASLGFDAAYSDILRSSGDGAVGVEDVDRAGLGVNVSLECTDVMLINAILAANVSNTTFSGKESGNTKWQNATVPGIVYHGADVNLGKAADGTLSMRGAVRFADGTKKLADVIQILGGQSSAPSQTYPARLYRPHGAAFNPGVVINPEHLESVRLSLSANLLQDYSDEDVGMTAVDVIDWGDLAVTLVHKDASQVAGSDRSTQLMEAARGVLTVSLLGRGGAAGKTLTVNNLLWTNVSQQRAREYWVFTMTGAASWRKPDSTAYTLNESPKLFSIG